MTAKNHISYIVDMEPQFHMIVGYMAFDTRIQRPVRTNAYPRETAKIYGSAGIAKAAMMNSNSREDYESGLINIIPVTVPTKS